MQDENKVPEQLYPKHALLLYGVDGPMTAYICHACNYDILLFLGVMLMCKRY